MWKLRLRKLNDFFKKTNKDKHRSDTQVDQKEKYVMMNSELFYLLSAFKIHLHRQYIVPL